MFTLRVRLPTRLAAITIDEATCTLHDLGMQLWSLTDVLPSAMQIRVGAPPTTIVLPEDRPDALLVEYGVTDHDTITVQMKPAAHLHLAVHDTHTTRRSSFSTSFSSRPPNSSSSGSIQRATTGRGQTLSDSSDGGEGSASRSVATAPSSDPFHGRSPHDPAFWPTTFHSGRAPSSTDSQAGPSQPQQSRPRKPNRDSPDPEPCPSQVGGVMMDLIREIKPSAGIGEGGDAGGRAVKSIKRPRSKGEAAYNHAKELKKVNAVPEGAEKEKKRKTIVQDLWESDLMAEIRLAERESFFNSWLTRKITPTTTLQELEDELDDQEVFAKWDPRFDFLARLELGEWSD